MIISASRRTDIPAFYSEWFFNRVNEGFADVQNPFPKAKEQVNRISLLPKDVDGYVFWTKNPLPMLQKIDQLKQITVPYYFQFTLTSYDKDIEPSLPSKNKVLIPTFQKLSEAIGKERVVWRYDPILLTDRYTLGYHKKYFEVMCNKIAPYTDCCVISFLDMYGKIADTATDLGVRMPTVDDRIEILKYFSTVANDHGIHIETCAEELSYIEGKFDVRRSKCVDDERFERISGVKLNIKKDSSQRKACGCVKSTDIGAYDSCLHGCVYCYANNSEDEIKRRYNTHDPKATMLISNT